MLTNKHQAGFTLLELIITIIILSIATGMTSQAWGWWAAKSRQRAILENYHSLFSFARWNAASSHTLVTVCPLSAASQCVDDWQQPVSVFIDVNNDKSPDGGSVLRQMNANLGSFTLRSRTAGRGYFQFNAKGMTHGAMGSLVLCPRDPASGTMTYMPINIAGRFRVEYDKDGDGIMKLPWGAKISC
ncbi:MAG: prepilin-type N-terminal cleavage/methylation domain-containing protein [Gammaproteobacteria bacterium]|nr:MAG: prepilin-type N-terminal cleavage/methylation domain-containing protein [Gammaproteobacteria bacterium]